MSRRSPRKKRSPRSVRSRSRSRPRSRSRSRSPKKRNSRSRSRSRSQYSKKRNSPRKRSGCRGVKPITTVKVCGPKKSCKYPNVYSRRELVTLAEKEGIKRASYTSTNQLCSRLALRKIKHFEKLRLIEGRICGAEKTKKHPRVWTRSELIDSLNKKYGKSPSSLRNIQRDDLCVMLDRLNYNKNKKVKRDINLNDVDYDQDLAGFKYEGQSRLLPFFYYLIHNYKNFCIYISPTYNLLFYIGITYRNCNTVNIEKNVVPFLKNCNKRFAFVLIKIKAPNADSAHLNFLLYDKNQKTLEQFEPLGQYYKCDKDVLNKALSEMAQEIGAIYVPSEEFCPSVGPQKFEAAQRGQYFHAKDNPGGFCAIWNVWTIEMRLRHPTKTLKEIIDKGIKLLELEGRGATNYILRYMIPKLRMAPELKLEAKKVGQSYGVYIYNLMKAELKGR